MTIDSNSIINNLNSMFIENGHVISHVFTGTSSLKSHYNTTQRNTLKNRFVNKFMDLTCSINRVYNHNTTDKSKQIIIDTILATYLIRKTISNQKQNLRNWESSIYLQ